MKHKFKPGDLVIELNKVGDNRNNNEIQLFYVVDIKETKSTYGEAYYQMIELRNPKENKTRCFEKTYLEYLLDSGWFKHQEVL
jgi:hypothetical protein